MDETEPVEFVQSFARGLAVLRAFDADHARLTLSAVARRAEVTRAAARRFLLTLAALGYVDAVDGVFRLTPRVLELGYGYLSALSVPEIAQPHLERLSHQVGHSSSAAVRDGGDIVYVARVPTRRIMSVSITIGTRFPAWATAMGRVLLAALTPTERGALIRSSELRPLTARTMTDPDRLADELDAIAGRGWAVVDGELEEGLRSVAAPVRDRSGAVVAAINISTGLEVTPDSLIAPLRAAAAAIDVDLRHV